MSRSINEQPTLGGTKRFRKQPTQPKGVSGLQARLLGQFAERQQNSAKGNEVWVEILEDRVSVGGYRLETVLSSVEERLGANAKILHTERQIVGGLGGFFGRETFVVEAALPKAALPKVSLPKVSLPNVSLPNVSQHESLLPVSPQPEADEDIDPDARVETDGSSFAEALAAALAQVDHAEAALASGVEFRSDSAFLTLGMGNTSQEGLIEQVADLMGPSAPLPSGGIVAVVGDPDECISAARTLAVSAGIDPGEVLIMSPEPVAGHPTWMCLTSIDDCERRRDRWIDDDRLHLVAVVLNAGPSGMSWACSSLDALEPIQTHLAVPGWRRVEDVATRLRSLAPITAIDLVGTADPITSVGFLDLDVPVSTIDGVEATAELWCSYLASASSPGQVHLDHVQPDLTQSRSGHSQVCQPNYSQLPIELAASTGVENLR
ncbi:MAG TPA: hypothetical protein VL068_14855 [Microthrixaceae bacterium]|nr:hypothetical protein [Microthrixaceae bacterium]